MEAYARIRFPQEKVYIHRESPCSYDTHIGGVLLEVGEQRSVEAVREYWEAHPLGKQFAGPDEPPLGSPEFFAQIRPWLGPFRFPWILERIEREAKILKGAHLLEVGCGPGFDSLEFLKRGVRVTAIDLTQTSVDLTRSLLSIEGFEAEEVRVDNVLSLSFRDNTFDAVWANGVLHHTGDTAQAIREIHRVLEPNGRAIISHFYRHPSWLHGLSWTTGENIEFRDAEAPVIDFLTEAEILQMFDGFVIEEAVPEHYRALCISRRGFKAWVYSWGFRPLFNLLPEVLAKHFAHKFSVTAVKG